MKINVIVLLLILSCISEKALAWGQTGHRVTGAIAEHYLNDETRKQINLLFPEASLAEISTYADEKRSESSEFWKKTANPWHYVTVPAGKTYQEVGAPQEGDAYTALNKFSEILKSPTSSKPEKQRALHFIVHLVGDLHQPLHVGNGLDRGGNSFKVEFFWQDSNLHRVWDTQMINNMELSYTELTHWLLRKISAEEQAKWQTGTPQQWMHESKLIREKIYPQQREINYQYQYQHLPTLKRRLQQAGVRLAHYLNQIFDGPSTTE